MEQKHAQKLNTPESKIQLRNFNEAVFQVHHENIPLLIRNGRRFAFEFTVNDNFLRVSGLYISNAKIAIRDYEDAQKKLKALMFEFDDKGQQQ